MTNRMRSIDMNLSTKYGRENAYNMTNRMRSIHMNSAFMSIQYIDLHASSLISYTLIVVLQSIRNTSRISLS